MNRVSKWALLPLLNLLLLSLEARAADWSAPFPLESPSSSSGYLFQIDVAGDGNGHWVAIWTSNRFFDIPSEKIVYDDDLYVSRSADNGATWTKPALLHSSMETEFYGDVGVHVTTDRQGRWMAVWVRSDQGRILYSVSTDNGASWSEPASPANTDVLENKVAVQSTVATNGDGTWVIAWYYDGDLIEPSGLAAVRSENGGSSWSSIIPIATDSFAYYGYAAPALASNGSTAWILAWQSQTNGAIRTTQSIDDGETWSTAEERPIAESIANSSIMLYPDVAIAADGTAVLAASGVRAVSEVSTESGIFVANSVDAGTNWSPLAPVLPLNDPFSVSAGPVNLALDSDDNWSLIWIEPHATDMDESIVYRSSRTTHGSAWATPEPLSSFPAFQLSSPVHAYDGAGTGVAIWHESYSNGSADSALVAARDPDLLPPTDINSDGGIDAVDVQLVINAVLGIGEGNADVNDDGATDAVDVQLVINAVLGL